MALKKSTDQINQEKLKKYQEDQKKAEQLKNSIAQLISRIQEIQSFIQLKNKELGEFHGILSMQSNLDDRLSLIQKSIVMFSNQLNSLKPKKYMVDEPQFPNLKINHK